MGAESASTRKLYQKVMSQYEKMAQMAAGTDESLNHEQKSVSQWSVRQHLDHMAKVDGFISMMAIEGALKTPPANAEKRPKPSALLLLTLGWLPRGKGKAPEATHPKAKNAAELRQSIAMIEPALRKLGERLEEIDKSAGRTPHPILGAFTAKQWLRFLDIHHRHHFRIINDILTRWGSGPGGT